MVDAVSSIYPLDWDDAAPNDIDAHVRKILTSNKALASLTLGRDYYQGQGLEKLHAHGTLDDNGDFVLLDDEKTEELGLYAALGRERELVGSMLEPTMFQCTATVGVENRPTMRRSPSGCGDAARDALDESFKRSSLPPPTHALFVSGQLAISTISHRFSPNVCALCIPGSPTLVSAEILAILKPESDVHDEWRILIQGVIDTKQVDVSRRGGAEKVRQQLQSAADLLAALKGDFPEAEEIEEDVLNAKTSFRVKKVRRTAEKDTMRRGGRDVKGTHPLCVSGSIPTLSLSVVCVGWWWYPDETKRSSTMFYSGTNTGLYFSHSVSLNLARSLTLSLSLTHTLSLSLSLSLSL
jgi:hypothetical protein